MAQHRRDARSRESGDGERWESNAGFSPSRGMGDPRMGNESWFGGERHQERGNPRVPGSNWSARSGWGESGRYPASSSDESREYDGGQHGRDMRSADDRFAWGGGGAAGYGRQSEPVDRMDDDGWNPGGSAGSDRHWQDTSNPYGHQEYRYPGPFGVDRDESQSSGSGAWGNRGGQFSGRGPKGYKRSEERIREDVCERLSAHGDIDASEIDVTIDGDDVVLTGTVGSRREKRLAEDCCDGIPGIEDVRNELRVQRREDSEGDGMNTNFTSADTLLPSISRQGRASNRGSRRADSSDA